MQRRVDLRIGAVGQQKLHQHDVAGLGGAQESRRAVLIQPLVGENRAGLRAVLHPGIHVGAFVQKELDEIQMIHVALADRIIAGFDIAVVGGQIERRPRAFVGEIHIGAVVQQIRSELVVPILRRDQQGAPAIAGDLVHVRSRRQQDFDGIEIVGADRVDQRRETAAIFRRPVLPRRRSQTAPPRHRCHRSSRRPRRRRQHSASPSTQPPALSGTTGDQVRWSPRARPVAA